MRIKLNRSFYTKEAVLETLEAYKELCSGDVVEKDEGFDVVLDPKEPVDEQELKNEFCNYVLSCMR